jgi:Cu2+-exporting ATPase
MTDVALAACPACVAGEPAARSAAASAGGPETRIDLSLPTIHCAACISAVENGLAALPGIRAARVNLTRRMVSIRADTADGLEDRLIAALARLGYEAWPLDSARLAAGADDSAGRDLLARLGVAGFAMMNVMLLSVSVWSGAEGAMRDLLHWVSALIALPAVAFAGQPFFRSALGALRARRLNMDVPISLAMILASAASLSETMQGGEHAYFDAAISLTFFLLAGRYLDFRTRAAARSAASELAALEVRRATRLNADGTTGIVDVASLSPGDTVLVPSGMKIPADGIVCDGYSEIDASLLTGESLPRATGPGDIVHAGMVNLGPVLRLTVTDPGDGMLVRRIARLVEAATAAKSRYVTLADRAARLYSPVVHIVALSAFAWWMATTGDFRTALNVAIATLIITCPCALGLAVPAVLAAASGRLFRMGVLLKDGAALERLAATDLAVFDKTGTLTRGQPELLDADALPRPVLALAAGLATGSAHPVSRAILAAAQARGIVPAILTGITEFPGQGVAGRHDARIVRLGRPGFAAPAAVLPDDGTLSTVLAVAGRPPVVLRLADALRREAAAAVASVAGLAETALLSGDAPASVARVAAATGIARALAGQTPQDKAAWLAARRAEGRHVLMVGDGLNDAAALASADVSMALASGMDATRAAADMVLTGNSLSAIPRALHLARSARARIIENFALAFVYNILAVPLAVAGQATPLAAAIAMSTSSILVSLNALRLRDCPRGRP